MSDDKNAYASGVVVNHRTPFDLRWGGWYVTGKAAPAPHFVDEAPIGRPIEGSSGFAAEFSARGPADRRGRSVRQLDLWRRLLRYPCSYMIYFEAFDALPSSAKELVYARL